MGIFAKLAGRFGSDSSIQSPWRESGILEQVTYEALFGNVSEIYVSRERAMKLPVVAKARRIATTTVGRLPLAATSPRSGTWPAGTFPLIEQPEDGFPLSNTLVHTIDALMFYPRAFWQITRRDAAGWPVRARFVPEGEAQTDDAGQLVRAFGQPVTPGEFIRFDGNDAGLLVDGADSIRRAMILQRVAAMAESNPVPSIELHNEGEDLTDTQIDALIKRWSERRRNGNVAYTSKSLKVETHGQAPEQLLIDARKRIDLDLARHTGAPAWVVDVPIEGQSLNYQNRASRNHELIDLFLSPYMTIIEDRLTMNDVTPRGTAVNFVTDELTRDDMQTRFKTYAIGIKGEFIDRAWIAKQEGWEAPR